METREFEEAEIRMWEEIGWMKGSYWQLVRWKIGEKGEVGVLKKICLIGENMDRGGDRIGVVLENCRGIIL